MSRKRVWLTIILAALMILATGCNKITSGIVEKLTTVAASQTQVSEGPTEAATKAARPTSVKARSTPTVAARPTAKPRTPVPVDTEVPYDGVMPIGDLLFQDRFDEDESDLTVYDGNDYSLEFAYDGYRITIFEPGLIAWSSLDSLGTDVVIEAVAVQESGPVDGDYGIIFRYQDADNFYVFKVSESGHFSVSLLENNTWNLLVDWTTSDAINQGYPNQVAVAMKGDTFTFYINGEQVASMRDDTFEDGNFAIFGSTYDEGDLEVLYTELNVYSYDESMSGVVDDPDYTESELLYYEDFSSNSSSLKEWDQSDSAGYHENGTYVIEVLVPNMFYWSNLGDSYSDFVVDVDTVKRGGSDDNHFGLVLRYQDSDNFYMFNVSSDGMYSFGYYEDDEWTAIVKWTDSSVINQGDNSRNHLTVEAVGDTFTLMVNGQVLETVQDSTFSSGDIGMYAGSIDDPGTKIAFDNLAIYEVN